MSASELAPSPVPVLPSEGVGGLRSLVALPSVVRWERLPDGASLARWHIRTTSGLSGRILASRDEGLLVVSVEGRLWSASTLEELAEGLIRTFERVDLATYRTLVQPLREAWIYLGHAVPEATSEVQLPLQRVATAFDGTTEQEVG